MVDFTLVSSSLILLRVVVVMCAILNAVITALVLLNGASGTIFNIVSAATFSISYSMQSQKLVKSKEGPLQRRQ